MNLGDESSASQGNRLAAKRHTSFWGVTSGVARQYLAIHSPAANGSPYHADGAGLQKDLGGGVSHFAVAGMDAAVSGISRYNRSTRTTDQPSPVGLFYSHDNLIKLRKLEGGTVVHSGELSKKSTGNTLSDMILGGQDGLVNVLGVILGVAAASNDPKIVIAGGLAATFAESISMAAVSLTSMIAERDHYLSELAREHKEMKDLPEKEEQEICDVYKKKGFSGKLLEDIVAHVISSDTLWVEQMMKDELELKEVKQKEIYKSSFIVGFSALVGSFVPLTPFFFSPIRTATWISLGISVIVLLAVGFYKAKATIGSPVKSAVQMALIGMGAALAGYFIGSIFGQQV